MHINRKIAEILALLVAAFSLGSGGAGAAEVYAPDQEVTQFTNTVYPDFDGDGPNLADDQGSFANSVYTSVSPGDTFNVRMTAPAGEEFSYSPSTASTAYDALLRFYVYMDDPSSENGTWDSSSMTANFEGLAGAPAPSAQSDTFYNNERVFSNDFYPTSSFQFTAIDLSFAVPLDASAGLVVDSEVVDAEVWNTGDSTPLDTPTLSLIPVPEPSACILLESASAALLMRRRRTSRSA